MASSVVGLFDTSDQAHFAVRQLLASGIDTTAISVVAADPGGTIVKETVDESGDMASAGAVSGAASGLLLGGLIGLLVGATVLAAPPVGFVIAGPLAGLITGAGVGFVSGGLLGALIGLGLPEEHAHIYAESVRRGGTLVTVNVLELDRIRVEQILAMAGSVNVTERESLYRQDGFVSYDPKSPVYTAAEIAAERQRLGIVPVAYVAPTTLPTAVAPVVIPAAIPAAPVALDYPAAVMPATTFVDPAVVVPDDLFMDDYWATYASTGNSFEQFRPAYRFGYEMAGKPDFSSLDWSVVEPRAQALWEQSNPGTWSQFRSAIHLGWSKAGALTAPSNGASLI